jgi:hypothetical protein
MRINANYTKTRRKIFLSFHLRLVCKYLIEIVISKIIQRFNSLILHVGEYHHERSARKGQQVA